MQLFTFRPHKPVLLSLKTHIRARPYPLFHVRADPCKSRACIAIPAKKGVALLREAPSPKISIRVASHFFTMLATAAPNVLKREKRLVRFGAFLAGALTPVGRDKLIAVA